MSRAWLGAVVALMPAACGGEAPVEEVQAPQPLLCDARLVRDEAWCGGDPVGSWVHQGVCHRPMLEALVEECPEGSFEVRAGGVHGDLTLTATQARLRFDVDAARPLEVELKPACTKVLGTCPRSFGRVLLSWTGDVEHGCVGRAQLDASGTVEGPVRIEGNELIYYYFNNHPAPFCASDEMLTFSGLSTDLFAKSPFFFIARRALLPLPQ